MSVNRVADVARGTALAADSTIEDILLHAQETLEQQFGPPGQILGGRGGSLTLRFTRKPDDLPDAVRKLGASIVSEGMTPLFRGGPAIVPNVIADWRGLTLIARGHVQREQLAGIEIVLSASEPLVCARGSAVIDFLHDALDRFPDPDEALARLIARCLELRYDVAPESGHRLAARLLRGISAALEESGSGLRPQ